MTPDIPANTPIIIGVGQVQEPSTPKGENFSSGIDLAAEAARRAIANTATTSTIEKHIDALTAIRFFEDSARKIAIVSNPLGASNNVPGSIARRLNINPADLIYAAVGGQTPQRLINEFSERIHRGENNCVVITGAEAIANIKYAVRNGVEANWHETIEQECEDRWLKNNADNMVSDYEMAHGLFLPVQAYPLFENKYRRQLEHTIDGHREFMARLFSPFSKVAASNPYAQFPLERTEEYLANPSADNYLLSEPYLKWFVAQDAVNQGAAVVLSSVGLARELGIPEEKWIYLHAYADLDDTNVVEREDLTVSHAQKLACEHALATADITIEDIEYLDIYSCFPIAVTSACSALGIDPFSRSLTLTGGLPFFGGPGNNYSMHAIAEIVERLRKNPTSNGMIIANGGYLSKHSVGIYSAAAPEHWRVCDSSEIKNAMTKYPKAKVIETPQGGGSIESYVATYQRGNPKLAYIFARNSNNERFIAKVKDGDSTTLKRMFDEDPIGNPITVSTEDGCNYFEFNH